MDRLKPGVIVRLQYGREDNWVTGTIVDCEKNISFNGYYTMRFIPYTSPDEVWVACITEESAKDIEVIC